MRWSVRTGGIQRALPRQKARRALAGSNPEQGRRAGRLTPPDRPPGRERDPTAGLFPLWLGLALLPGCGGGIDNAVDMIDGFVQRDSGRVLIVETSGTLARAHLSWEVQPDPELQIGVLDGAPEYTFSLIDAVRELDGGRLAVSDRRTREIRFFDDGGSFLYKVGGAGDGPEDFRTPRVVPALHPRDRLLVMDRTGGRFVFVGAEGEWGASTGIPAMPPGDPVGVVGSTVLIGDVAWRSPTLDPGPANLPATYLRFLPERLHSDTLVGFAGRGVVVADGLNPVPTVLRVPYDVDPSATVGPATFFVAEGHRPEVLEFDENGELQRILRIVEEPEPVPADELQAWVAERVSRFVEGGVPRGVAEVPFREMEVPEFLPTIQSLIVDDTGHLWVEAYRPMDQGPPEWVVFSADGRALGMVSTPPGLQVHVIAETHMIGVWEDELGVQYVRRHTLTRADPDRP